MPLTQSQNRPLTGPLLAALNRMELAEVALRADDGLFRRTDKYWSITCKEMAALELRGCVRIDRVGESTFATFLKRV